jgi:hypothetical protein
MSELHDATSALAQAADIPVVSASPTTKVGFYGVWNAGKSTLMKRLLVEYGADVPDWLTIAAAPETNFIGDVVATDAITFIDTPGINAGMALHEGEAAQVLFEADVVVVLVLPKLLGGDERNEIVGILRGKHVTVDGWPWTEGSVKLLITQLDQGGFDPVKDSQAFSAFAGRKLDELRGVLAERDVELPEAPGFVIADLYAAVSDDREDVEIDDYVSGPWDGIAALRTWLDALPHEQVRQDAATRRLVHAASQVADAQLATAASLREQARIWRSDVAQRKDQLQQLGQELAAAQVDLIETLENFAGTVYSEGTDGGEELSARKQAAINGWFERQATRFEGLEIAVEADPTFGDGASGPRGAGRATFESLVNDPAVGGLGKKLIEGIFGEELGDLRDELKKTKDQSYWEDATRMFKDPNHAKGLNAAMVAADVLPDMIEVVGLLRQLRTDPTPEHERRARELRDRVREGNKRTVHEVMKQVSAHLDVVRQPLEAEIASLSERTMQAESGIAQSEAAASDIAMRIADLRAITSNAQRS